MNQHTGTGLPPVHHDHGEARYALTDAGHGALAPTGVPPSPPGVVLACINCDHVYEPTAAGRLGQQPVRVLAGLPRDLAHRLGQEWSTAQLRELLSAPAPTEPATGGGR